MRPALPLLTFALALIASPLVAQALPDALTRDPPAVPGHPARLEQVRYPTGGVEVPARLFIPGGTGPHPTMLLLHGFPGTELNLDLARVFQRAGWAVMAIHYRGVWGGSGQFSFGHVVEDAHAALAWLRSPAAAAYRIDAKRVVVLGHSMGGFATVMLGDDKAVSGYVLVSAADMGRSALSLAGNPGRVSGFADDASYTTASVDSLVADARAHAGEWDWSRRAAMMAGRPVLVVTSDDGLAPVGEAAARAVRAAGGPPPETVHMATDHSFNDHRIALAATILRWLEARMPAR